MKASRTEFVNLNNMRLCMRHWGDEDAPKLFMVHGWMDISASFQFIVDAMKRDCAQYRYAVSDRPIH